MAAVEMTEPNRRSFAVRGKRLKTGRVLRRGRRLARRAKTAVADRCSAALWSGVIDKKKDPVVGSTGSSNPFKSCDDRSGRLRGSLLGHAFCLRAFLSLNDFKFNIIALLEALVSLRLDGTIVDEHIRAVIPADKAEALCVIEPFHFTFNSRHVPYSGLSLGTLICGPEDQFFFSWVCHSVWEGTQNTGALPSPGTLRLIPVLWLCAYSALITR